MRRIFEKTEFVVGIADTLSKMPALSAMRIFDERVIMFLNALSGEILKSDVAKNYPDAVTFAFWCRKANLMAIKKQYEGEGNRLGRGTIFHIAPSNVPLNFAYSMAVAMLAGNASVVRLPSRRFEQTYLVCEAIVKLLKEREFEDIANRLCFIRYAYNKDVTDALSAICDSRIIWGGDMTVGEIRKSPLAPHASEITFPDRYSICVINADKYLTEYDKEKTARDFYNDTYLTDQNACTSPRIVIWLGSERERAKSVFWSTIYGRLGGYEVQPLQTVNKLTTLYRFAANSECKLIKADDCKIMRIAVNNLDDNVLSNLGNSGFFYEYDANALEEVLAVCGNKCQTLSYIGFNAEELLEFILQKAPSGVDRIIPVGKTMDFSVIWDGKDLIRELSRVVSV